MKHTRVPNLAILLLAMAVIGLSGTTQLKAAETPLLLHWKELIPPVQVAPKLKPFFAGASPTPDDGGPPPPPKPEGRWMSTPVPKAATPTPLVTALDGKLVRISGYLVPLDFDATKVKEFLLVPYMGACIHVPPPPANQIVYVKLENGFDIDQTYDVVTVTGKLAAALTSTGLAEVGYSIDPGTVAKGAQQ